MKENYILKTKKCFHELGGMKDVHNSKSAIVSELLCSVCNKVYGEEVCSPWHDGCDQYNEPEYTKIRRDIEDTKEKISKKLQLID